MLNRKHTQRRPTDPLSAWRAPGAFGPDWADWLQFAWHFMGNHLKVREIVKLCPETREHFYDADVPSTRYQKGSRPVLDNLLYELLEHPVTVRRSAPNTARHLAEWTYWEVYRRGRVLQRGKWTQQLIAGGDEEEIVAFDGRTGSFECSRLLCTLLQMEGIPARLAFIFAVPYDGRVGVEAHLNGQWRFFDVKENRQYRNRRGGLLGLWQAAGEVQAPPQVLQLALADYPIKEHSTWIWAVRAQERLTPRGKIARTLRDLAPYRGWKWQPEYLRATVKHSANEPPMAGAVRLCAETSDYLYTKFTPTVVRYRRGSRPVLEGLLAEVILRDRPRPRSDQEFLFTIWDWVWKNVHRRLNQVAWPVHHRKLAYLGSAEDIASFRCRADCYCSSKLATSLLQAGGIPARLVYMFAPKDGGSGFSISHTAVEAYFDDKWRFFDPLCHDYAVTRKGDMASFWEIATDRWIQTVGMHADRAQHDKAITRPECFDDISIHNYPIAESTRHYEMANGSYWFDRDSRAAKRVCRYGL